MVIGRPLPIVAAAVQVAASATVVAQSALSGGTIRISRAAAGITVDGDQVVVKISSPIQR